MESVDLCSPINPCFMNGNCTSTPGVNSGFKCAACRMGYKGDGYKCYGGHKHFHLVRISKAQVDYNANSGF